MVHCINQAREYLKQKYGSRKGSLTSKSEQRLKARTKKKRKEIKDSFTDKNYYEYLNPATEEFDKYIELLMSQYYLSIQVRKELQQALQAVGVKVES